MIERVVHAAVVEAIRSLPPRAMGLRSHALPTEDHLNECIAGVERVLRDLELPACHVVIGSSAPPSRTPEPRITVLPCDEAAAEATRLRSLRDDLPPEAGPRLLYFNTDSTPGESGLDVLSELSAHQIALAFARTAGLTRLEALASSSSRRVRARLEDASVADLADYAARARARTETHALPLLRFVPSSKPSAAGPTAADAFDALRGAKAVSGLQEALTFLGELGADSEQRAAANEALSAAHPLLSNDDDEPFEVVIRLCQSATRYAKGETDDASGLCGLTAELARALRRGKDGVERIVRPDDSTGPAPAPTPDPTRPMTEEDIVEEFGAGVLASPVTLNEDEWRVTVEVADGPLEVRARKGGLAHKVIAGITADLWRHGGALVSDGAQPGAAPTVFLSAEKALAAGDDEFRAAVAEFRRTREQVLKTVAELGGGDDEPNGEVADGGSPDYLRAIRLLESHPLTVVSHARQQCTAYVEAYERLARLFGDDRAQAPQPVTDWMTDLDVAFSVVNQRVHAATLLPLHPLRIAHSLLWTEHGVRPPPMPPSLAVHYRTTDHLMPQGRDYAYAALRAAAPSEGGVALAAREGLRAVWGLLRGAGLVSAFEVELIDIAAPAAAVDALCDAAAELLDEDAEVPGAHLNIRFAYSSTEFEREVSVAARGELSSDAQEFMSAPRGDGVSVSLTPNTVAAGGPAHLAVQAIEVPFVPLADDETSAFPAAEFVYIPSRSGSISAVEVAGNETLTAYETLLKGIDAHARRRGLDPSNAEPDLGRALVKSLVARRGWPVRPSGRAHLLTYDVGSDDHVVATLAAPELFQAIVLEGLDRVTQALPPEEVDPARLRDGVVAMYACRTFFRNLVSDHDPRHLRGALGLLRAFDAARRDATTPALVLSIDGPEGQRWARRMAQVDGGDNTRADLLMLEADATRDDVLRIRVAELKAGQRTQALGSEKALAALARQAQITASRLRACFGAEDAPGQREAREALRRLTWLGAGAQLLAHDWQRALTALDARLREGRPPEILTECWIVPEEPWTGEDRFELVLKRLTPSGEESDADEVVRYRVLPAQPPADDDAEEEPVGPAGPSGSFDSGGGPATSGDHGASLLGPSVQPAGGSDAAAPPPVAATRPFVATNASAGSAAPATAKPHVVAAAPEPPLTQAPEEATPASAESAAPATAKPHVAPAAPQPPLARAPEEDRLDEVFDGFVGNNHAVDVIRTYLLYALSKGVPRIDSLGLFGPKSTGKTELAGRIGLALDVPVIYLSEARLTKADDLADQLREEVRARGLQMHKGQTPKGERADTPPPVLVFIDEVHLLKDKVQDALLTALEPQDRVLRAKGKSIDTRPLTFVIATTDKGALREAFLSRVRAIDLTPYTVDEVVQILEHRRRHDTEIDPVASSIPPEGLRHIAVAARAVPRQAISLLKEVAMVISLGKLQPSGPAIFDHLRTAIPCDENGLTDLDWRYLKILQRGGAKGLKPLVAELGVDVTTVQGTVEPYLMGQRWIEVTPNGRVLTQRGWTLVRAPR